MRRRKISSFLHEQNRVLSASMHRQYTPKTSIDHHILILIFEGINRVWSNRLAESPTVEFTRRRRRVISPQTKGAPPGRCQWSPRSAAQRRCSTGSRESTGRGPRPRPARGRRKPGSRAMGGPGRHPSCGRPDSELGPRCGPARPLRKFGWRLG